MQNNQSKYYVRFVLEVIALLYLGWWGNGLAAGWWGVLAALAIVGIAMLLWGVFNVPGDPSRSGKAPVKVSGILRLAIEFLIFGVATFALFAVTHWVFAALYATAVVAHYIHTKSRVIWILKR